MMNSLRNHTGMSRCGMASRGGGQKVEQHHDDRAAHTPTAHTRPRRQRTARHTPPKAREAVRAPRAQHRAPVRRTCLHQRCRVRHLARPARHRRSHGRAEHCYTRAVAAGEAQRKGGHSARERRVRARVLEQIEYDRDRRARRQRRSDHPHTPVRAHLWDERARGARGGDVCRRRVLLATRAGLGIGPRSEVRPAPTLGARVELAHRRRRRDEPRGGWTGRRTACALGGRRCAKVGRSTGGGEGRVYTVPGAHGAQHVDDQLFRLNTDVCLADL